MNRFRFRFAAVLRYREMLKEQRERSLAQANRALAGEENTLAAFRRDAAAHDHGRVARSVGTVSARDLATGYGYAQLLDRRTHNQEEAVRTAEGTVARARSVLVEAVKHTRIFSRLRDRDLEAWEVGARREEQAMNDEVATTRFRRSS